MKDFSLIFPKMRSVERWNTNQLCAEKLRRHAKQIESLSSYEGDSNENVKQTTGFYEQSSGCAHFGTFLYSALQNNNVKMTSFKVFLENGKLRLLFLYLTLSVVPVYSVSE